MGSGAGVVERDVAHLAGVRINGQWCARCGWTFPAAAPSHVRVEQGSIEEGAVVEYRVILGGFTLTVLNVGDPSSLPPCEKASR